MVRILVATAVREAVKPASERNEHALVDIAISGNVNCIDESENLCLIHPQIEKYNSDTYTFIIYTCMRPNNVDDEVKPVVLRPDICMCECICAHDLRVGDRSRASIAAPGAGLALAGVGYDTREMCPLNKQKSNKKNKRIRAKRSADEGEGECEGDGEGECEGDGEGECEDDGEHGRQAKKGSGEAHPDYQGDKSTRQRHPECQHDAGKSADHAKEHIYRSTF
jgi:hypothetical protein